MMYLFTGSDAGKVRTKAFQWVTAARQKAPDAVYVRLSSEQVTPESLADAMSAQGLFFSRSLVLLDDPFSLSESGEMVLEYLDELAASSNPIAILAPKLLATRVKKIEAKATKVFVENAVQKATRGFNSGLVNALANKDRALLWQELQKAYRQGDVPELVHGLLHWKAREMMQKGGGKWGKEGARKLSRELIELVSDSRNGDLGLREGLERFALSM